MSTIHPECDGSGIKRKRAGQLGFRDAAIRSTIKLPHTKSMAL